MSWILDGILILVPLLILLICVKNGFLKSVLMFGKTVLSIILAFLFGGVAANLLANGFIGEKIHGAVYRMFLNMYETGTSSFDLSAAVQKIPKALSNLLEKLNVDMEAISSFGTMTSATEENLREFSSAISTPIVSFVSSVLGYLFVFLISLILIAILIHVSDLVTKLPIIHFSNKFLGLLLGVLMAVIVAVLLARAGEAILAIVSANYPESEWASAYERTYLMRWIVGILGH